ncbi:MAG: heme ABC transporter ATP-binding protein [Pseudomonadota bacterium]
MCVLEHVAVRAGDKELLHDVSLTVAPGEIVVVLGPNGAGKSTLLKTFAGDLIPTRGRALIMGEDISRLSIAAQAAHRAVVQQSPPMVFDFTVAEVIQMGWLEDVVPSECFEDAYQSVVAETDTGSLLDRVFNTLSGGERQRVLYACALLQIWRPRALRQPRWLLLDEPTANLDVRCALELMASIRRQAAAGIGILVVLHDLNLAARFADRVMLLNLGRSAGLGAPRQVMTASVLSEVYQTEVRVDHHPELDRLVVLT